MTSDDPIYIRGQKECERDDLINKLDADRKKAIALMKQLAVVVYALQQEYSAKHPEENHETNHGNIQIISDEPVPGFSETYFYPSVDDVISVLSGMRANKEQLERVENCLTKLKK